MKPHPSTLSEDHYVLKHTSVSLNTYTAQFFDIKDTDDLTRKICLDKHQHAELLYDLLSQTLTSSQASDHVFDVSLSISIPSQPTINPSHTSDLSITDVQNILPPLFSSSPINEEILQDHHALPNGNGCVNSTLDEPNNHRGSNLCSLKGMLHHEKSETEVFFKLHRINF